MLGPLICGQVSLAPLLPKLRGHFAEFLDNASPVGLGLLDLSTCVGLRYGSGGSHSGFSRQAFPTLRYSSSLRVTHLDPAGLLSPASLCACTLFPFRARLLCLRPRSSVPPEHRILYLSSIAYASPPRLRSRLTQGRSALPWNPRTSGLDDSHIHLATHSGILPSVQSTTPLGMASACTQCSPTSLSASVDANHSTASAALLAPCIFGAGPLG